MSETKEVSGGYQIGSDGESLILRRGDKRIKFNEIVISLHGYVSGLNISINDNKLNTYL